MIGLDTNVLVRYLVKDDPVQAEAARAAIETCTSTSPGWVNRVVTCELVWVLERVYRLPRAKIAEALLLLLNAEQLRFEVADILPDAVVAYRDQRLDLADYLIGRTNLDRGCGTTLTFDTAAATLPFFSTVAPKR